MAGERNATPGNPRVARLYGYLTAALLAAAYWIGGWGWLLVWPAISSGLLALAYGGIGGGIFQKKNGLLSPLTRIVLLFYMIGARISVYYYCRSLNSYFVAEPGVWVGRRLNTPEANEAIQKGVSAVLDLTAGFPETAPFLQKTYHNIQLMPLTVPNLAQLSEAVEFVKAQSDRGIVYVHGALGYSRSVGVLAAYMLSTGKATNVDDAVAKARDFGPHVLLDQDWIGRLREFHAGMQATRVAAPVPAS